MAFDQHIEADKVDDLGFFATFLRAPVVGSLMWVLGGESAKKREKEERQQKMMPSCHDQNESCEGKPQSILIKRPFHESDKFRRTSTGSSKRKPPHLIGSDDLSELAHCAIASEHEDSAISQSERSFDLKCYTSNSRSLSWSDENGQKLVQVIGEPNENTLAPHRRFTKTAAATTNDHKGSMRRTKSVKGNTETTLETVTGEASDSNSDTSRYLPRGLGGGHSGLNIPTKPFGEGPPQGTSSFSPEWGWYINTTPPTPEMYQSQTSRKSKKKKKDEKAEPPLPPPVTHHTAFAKGFKQAAGETANMGWPGVPI